MNCFLFFYKVKVVFELCVLSKCSEGGHVGLLLCMWQIVAKLPKDLSLKIPNIKTTGEVCMCF